MFLHTLNWKVRRHGFSIWGMKEDVSIADPNETTIRLAIPEDMTAAQICLQMATVWREMYPKGLSNFLDHMLVTVDSDSYNLVAVDLPGKQGESAWDRAQDIATELGLTLTVRSHKCLIKGRGDDYMGKRSYLRFSVTRSSLQLKDCHLPIHLRSGHEVFPYHRYHQKALFLDRQGMLVKPPRPSHSPDNLQLQHCTF